VISFKLKALLQILNCFF